MWSIVLAFVSGCIVTGVISIFAVPTIWKKIAAHHYVRAEKNEAVANYCIAMGSMRRSQGPTITRIEEDSDYGFDDEGFLWPNPEDVLGEDLDGE